MPTKIYEVVRMENFGASPDNGVRRRTKSESRRFSGVCSLGFTAVGVYFGVPFLCDHGVFDFSVQ